VGAPAPAGARFGWSARSNNPPFGGLFPQDPTACQADPTHQQLTVPTRTPKGAAY